MLIMVYSVMFGFFIMGLHGIFLKHFGLNSWMVVLLFKAFGTLDYMFNSLFNMFILYLCFVA